MNLKETIKLTEEALKDFKHIRKFDLQNDGARQMLASHIANYIINNQNGKN